MKPRAIRIPFSRPALTGQELTYLQQSLASNKLSGDGPFTKKTTEKLQQLLGVKHLLLTTSCTDALEMSALLLNIGEGDEVIMPSFTFVSTANAFVLRGAKIVFVDIEPDTMNMDYRLVEAAITKKTKAIVAVHYAGICGKGFGDLVKLAKSRNIALVEDAAQSILSTYENKPLGTFGDLACLSFHETKNLNCGEGGALIINNPDLFERAEILREKGTNRSKFFRGQTDKYTWMDVGSSFLMGELTAAFLYAQAEQAINLIEFRKTIYERYQSAFREIEKSGELDLLRISSGVKGNGHLFYLKLKNEQCRADFIAYMNALNVATTFHYIPLHSAPAGLKFSRFHGEDRYTTVESERLVRLPIYHGMTDDEVQFVIDASLTFLKAAR